MKTFFYSAVLLCAAWLLPSCMEWDYIDTEKFTTDADGLFIACEGNFQYSNASLSYYDPDDDTVLNEVFARANGFKLGDVAQSMTIRGDRCWIVVNNSHVVFAIDTNTFREVGRIENLTSPRYMHFVSDEKAYITQLWDNRIFIVNPKQYRITGYITVPDMTTEAGSTEQMVQIGRYVYCNCWSYQNRIIKIDTETDLVVDILKVGIQPRSLAADRNGKLWTATDGGYEGSPYGHEPPGLYRIDPETFTIEQSWTFSRSETIQRLQTGDDGSRLYWIDDGVWMMDVDATRLPAAPLIPSRGTLYYGMTISPYDGDIYVADAIDYQQAGCIYRYSPAGELISEFSVGIIPSAFAWK